MATLDDTIVPVIDLAEALAGDEHARRRCALELDAAAQGSGFFVITGHGIPDALIDDAVRVARAFFALPVERKLELTTPMSYRGYQGMSATALAQTLGDESLPDLSESFNIGRYDDEPDVDGNPDAAAMCHPNLWPDEPVELRSVFRRYFDAMDALSAELLRLLAQALGAAPETYVSRNEFANSSMMLVNYYPAVDITPPPGQLRRGAHSDYGTITLLFAESEPGLQIRNGDEWFDVPAVEGGLVVNIGDLLAMWSEGRWTSTVHRVLVPEGRADRDRVSIPFFVHPDFFTDVRGVRAGEWIAAKSRSMMADDD